jgi:hypothetical protein
MRRASFGGEMDSLARRDVLIVSGSPRILEVLHNALVGGGGYECLLAADGREGMETFRELATCVGPHRGQPGPRERYQADLGDPSGRSGRGRDRHLRTEAG